MSSTQEIRPAADGALSRDGGAQPSSLRVTARPGESSAGACRRLGWTVGTRLVGNEGHGPVTIRLTAIGERNVLAVCEDRSGREGVWTLAYRDWQVVT